MGARGEGGARGGVSRGEGQGEELTGVQGEGEGQGEELVGRGGEGRGKERS